MRIISKQKDYYDHTQGYGHDPNIVWVRKPERVYFPDISFDKGSLVSKPYGSGDVGVFMPMRYERITGFFLKTYYFGICGRVMLGHSIVDKHYFKDSNERFMPHYEISYHLENHVRKLWMKRTFDMRVKRHIEQYSGDESDAYDLFLELQTPIFYYCSGMFDFKMRQRYLIKDAILKDTPYTSSVGLEGNPHLLFQEISQFISGHLRLNDSQMVETDEESRMKAKGLDKDSMVGHGQPKKRKKKKRK